MRKIFFLPFLLLTLTASAQEGDAPSQRSSVVTGSFWSNWFVEADAAYTTFYRDRSTPAPATLSSSLDDSSSKMGLSLAIGKWFTPGLGLRTRLGGFWGPDAADGNGTDKYWAMREQVMLNFSNLFAGYSTTRRWNLIPYLSAALARNMSCDTYAMGLGFGLMNQWHLTPKTAIHLDLGWDIYEPDFDGVGGNVFARGLHGHDSALTLSIGITYSLGTPFFKPVPDIDALRTLTESQLDALNAQLADEQAENARLRKLLGK